MSSTGSSVGASSKSNGFTRLGGIPESKDIAPSIIFLIAYAFLVFGNIYRMIARSSRYWQDYRMLVFCLTRVGMFACRTYIGFKNKNNDSVDIGYYIAESVLLYTALPLIVLECIVLVITMFEENLTTVPRGKLISRGLKSTLIAPLVLLIYVAANTSGGSSSTSKDVTIRHAAYGILLGVSAILFLVTVSLGHIPVVTGHFGTKTRYLAIWMSGLATGITVYRMIQSFSKPGDAVNNIAVFYVIGMLFEFAFCVPFGVINMRKARQSLTKNQHDKENIPDLEMDPVEHLRVKQAVNPTVRCDS